ncbi:MAG: hypothetical protein ABW217_22070 [Polyangiaceae bacterium]
MLVRRTLVLVIAVYVALVATHKGEFWPFSVYPMFASAGRPWQRALVRVVGDAAGRTSPSYPLAEVPGAPLPLGAHAVPQDDLSAIVQRAERWGDSDTAALARMFGALPCRAPLLVLRVRGSLEPDALRQVATPVARIGCEHGLVRVERLLAAGPS